MFFIRVVGRTIGTSIRHFVVFVALAIVAYAAARATSLLTSPILPVPDPHAADMITTGLLRLGGWHLFEIPAAVIACLAVGMIVHRAYTAWGNGKLSLGADAIAAGRAFWSLAAVALVWVVLDILPYLPDWFRKPPVPADWYWSVDWLPTWARVLIYEYVHWHPFITIGTIVLLVLGILWCLVVPAAVVERLGPIAAFRRSLELTKRRRLRIFALWLIYAVLGMGLIAGFDRLEHIAQLQAWPVKPILEAVRWILGTIVMAVGTAAIYLESRRLEALTTPAGATAPEPTAPQ